MVTGLKNMGSKQKATWESILAYVKEHGGSTTITFELGDVVGSSEMLDKLVSRKVLKVKKYYNNGFYYSEYSVNPDYLPSEPAATDDESDSVKFAKGQRVYLPANKAFKDTKEPAYGTVQHVENHINSAGKPFQRVWVQFDDIKRGLMEVHPEFLIVSAEPADDARPTLDAERAEVLDAMMASYDERIAALEMENAALETALDLERNENAKLQEKLAAEIKNADHWADMYKRLKKHGYLKFDEQD